MTINDKKRREWEMIGIGKHVKGCWEFLVSLGDGRW